MTLLPSTPVERVELDVTGYEDWEHGSGALPAAQLEFHDTEEEIVVQLRDEATDRTPLQAFLPYDAAQDMVDKLGRGVSGMVMGEDPTYEHHTLYTNKYADPDPVLSPVCFGFTNATATIPAEDVAAYEDDDMVPVTTDELHIMLVDETKGEDEFWPYVGEFGKERAQELYTDLKELL